MPFLLWSMYTCNSCCHCFAMSDSGIVKSIAGRASSRVLEAVMSPMSVEEGRCVVAEAVVL